MTDKLWYFNVVGSAGLDRLLTVFLYASKRYAIRHFVIDSLTCGLMSTRWGWWAGGWICTRWQKWDLSHLSVRTDHRLAQGWEPAWPRAGPCASC